MVVGTEASCPWELLPSYLAWSYHISIFKAESKKWGPLDQMSEELQVSSYVTVRLA